MARWLLWGLVLAPVALVGCGGASMPSSPSSSVDSMMMSSGEDPGVVPAGDSGTATPVALTGVVRRVDAQARTFALQTRTATHAIHTNDETQVMSRGMPVRFSSLQDGQSASIRGYDYGRYVLARTIAVN